MKLRTTFQMRCLAFAMALVLVITGSGLGEALRVFAVTDDRTVLETNVAELVAGNYELSEAEEALLNSGLLKAEHIHYTAPNNDDGLIVIDEENKQVTAENYDDGHGNTWIPVTAYVLVNGEVVETLAVVDNKCTYECESNALSVKVDYVLNVTVETAVQDTLMNTGFWLKEGVAQAGEVAAQYGFISAVEQAMPDLVELANTDVDLEINGTVIESVGLPQETKDAIYALNEEMAANGGILKLTSEINTHDLVAKTYYVLTAGLTMKAEAETLATKIAAIDASLAELVEKLQNYQEINLVDQETVEDVELLQKITAELAEALAAVEAQTWTAAEKGTALVADGITAAGYEALDELVAALGEQTYVVVKENLNVSTTTLQQNLSMFNVTFKVVLNRTEDVVGSTNLVEYGYSEITVTLLKDATAADILAVLESTNVEADALALWTEEGVYAAEHFASVATALPETLTEDITYTVTYSPVDYTLSLGYGEDLVVPYGYKYMLPYHEDAAQSYDYVVNGVKKAQGEIIVVLGDTTVTRTAGKAYASYDLYSLIADNYKNELVKAILESGALKGNEIINVRKPDPADAESLLTLIKPNLTAQNYGASYMGLSWVPYTYGTTGTENKFNGSNTATWEGSSVKVQYRLDLTNYTADEVQAILVLAQTLKAEANAQQSTLDSFASNYDTMGQLDKTKLGALNGVIGVTDFTPGDGTDTDARNLELRAYFAEVVGAIIANHLDADGKLTIYNMLGQYNVDGLRYYYNNAAAFIAEIEALAGYLGDMIAEEEALSIMVTAAGFPEYAEKITGLEDSLATVMENLTMPNEAIDLSSPNLGKLMDALTTKGEVILEKQGKSPYILSEMLTALDDSTVIIQVIIETPKGNATVTSGDLVRGQTVISQQIVNELKAAVNAKVNELLGGNTAFYAVNVTGSLDELVGQVLDANANIYYAYSVKNFTVKLDGQVHETINIGDLEINLPKHPSNGWRYEYTVDGVSGITASTYTFTTEQVLRLFVDGTYNITRTAINEGEEKFENTFGDWLIRDGEGNLVQILAAVSGDQNGIVNDFAMKIINSGYSYIALNGEPLMYLNAANELEISLQTLVNAILKDNTFGADTLINLGKNGKGKLVEAKMTLGNAADDILYEDVPFALHLTSVPGIMGTVANGLNAINPYIDFNSKDGVMTVDVTLPEKVYEVYLAGLLVTGNIDKTDMTKINSEIAFQFLWDYVDLIINTEADATTATNTLKKLGIDRDLTGYDKYYQMVKKVLQNPGVVINPEDENESVDLSVTGKGQKGINALINLLGIDVGSYSTYLGMIKEYKDAEAELTVSAVAELTNTQSDFQAAVIDVRASGLTNKADFTNNLPERIAQISQEGAVILVGNVTGNLVVNGTVILDLNGFTVDGNIVSNGTLIIVDSSLESVDCGRVTGTVSGNVTVIGGTYDQTLSADLLKDGYKQEADGSVVNNMFKVVYDENTNTYTYEINSDVITYSNGDLASHIPSVRALAVDIAVDLVLNYYTAAALTVDGDLYHINIEDIIALVAGTNRIDTAIQTVLDCIDVPGIGVFANSVLDDLLNFGNLYTAFANETAFANYGIKVAPWQLTVKHVTEGDYITFGIGNNQELAKEYNVALKLVGNNKNRVLNILKELGDHVSVDANVDLKQPTYDGAGNDLFVNGTGELDLTLHFNYDEYRTVVAVVLANGNADKAEALIAALNTGMQDPLKDVIDTVTVQDIFDALKALNRNDTFAGLCEELGVNVETAEAERVEGLFHIILCAAGKGLELLDIDGPEAQLGKLDADDDGVYVWTKTVTRAPDATVRGYTVYAEASVTVTITLELFDECEHLNTKTVKENEIPADCVNPGSYEEVVYCVDCGEVLSRTTVEIPALGHVAGDTVIENKVDAECEVDGHYDEVVYCSVCGDEISRNTVTIPALEHVPGTPVYENVVAPDCTNPGSHDEVIYCDVCGEQLERKTVHDSALGHNWGEWTVVEEPTCEKVGKKERTCSVCGHVESEIIPVTEHVAGEAVKENIVPATCTENGSYDEVINCSVCGHEMSRTTVTVEATGHVPGEVVIENEDPATCTENGSYDEVVYCSVCGEELNRETVTVDALGHDWTDWVVVVQPDVGVEGRKERTCRICGEVEFQIIPALDAPPTGDEFPVALYVSMMVMSVVGMAVLVWFMLAMKKTGRYSSK